MRLSMFASLAKASFAFGVLGCVVSMGASTALAEQACVRTSAGAKVCGELLPAEGGNLAQRQEENEFVFELQGCKRSSSTVICDLLLTDLSAKSRIIALNGSNTSPQTRSISTGGDEIRPEKLRLGKEERYYNNPRV